MKDILCIYHGNCADGFGAAWVIRRKFGEENVDFHAGVYQSPPPDCSGRNVWMVDFSYKRPIILEIAKVAHNVVIIDHHKTAQEDLIDLPQNVSVNFDMNHSGAMLAWQHCFGFEEPPDLLLHIEDRDLWRFNLPFTREIVSDIFSYPFTFSAFDELIAKPIEMVIHEGTALERKHQKEVETIVKYSKRTISIAGHTVPLANVAPMFQSDVGHALAKITEAKFCLMYQDTNDGRVFSLRSTDDGPDVSAIAKQYGGGGHAHASGFKVPYGHPLTY